jgi:hypothetical protein
MNAIDIVEYLMTDLPLFIAFITFDLKDTPPNVPDVKDRKKSSEQIEVRVFEPLHPKTPPSLKAQESVLEKGREGFAWLVQIKFSGAGKDPRQNPCFPGIFSADPPKVFLQFLHLRQGSFELGILEVK